MQWCHSRPQQQESTTDDHQHRPPATAEIHRRPESTAEDCSRTPQQNTTDHHSREPQHKNTAQSHRPPKGGPRFLCPWKDDGPMGPHRPSCSAAQVSRCPGVQALRCPGTQMRSQAPRCPGAQPRAQVIGRCSGSQVSGHSGNEDAQESRLQGHAGWSPNCGGRSPACGGWWPVSCLWRAVNHLWWAVNHLWWLVLLPVVGPMPVVCGFGRPWWWVTPLPQW